MPYLLCSVCNAVLGLKARSYTRQRHTILISLQACFQLSWNQSGQPQRLGSGQPFRSASRSGGLEADAVAISCVGLQGGARSRVWFCQRFGEPSSSTVAAELAIAAPKNASAECVFSVCHTVPATLPHIPMAAQLLQSSAE